MHISKGESEEQDEIVSDPNSEQIPATREQVIEFYTKANEVLLLRKQNAEYECDIIIANLNRILALQKLGSLREEPLQENSSEQNDTRDTPTEKPVNG